MNRTEPAIAVVGATGAVGMAILEVLAERNFPVGRLQALASARSVGETLMFRGHQLIVEDIAACDFAQLQLAFFSAGASVSAEYAPQAAAAGCVVVDNTSWFRRDDDVPLIVPEVNPHALVGYQQRNIIANPNCSTIQMLLALKPLHDAAIIERINVATYQAVSGAGRAGITELSRQTAEALKDRACEPGIFSKQIAFNVLPHIGAFQDNGYTLEEMKMIWETQKILGAPALRVNPTCVRVPVFYGHSEAVHIETRNHLPLAEARRLLEAAPGVTVMDEHIEGGYPTAVPDASGKDPVFVGRLRADISHPNGLNLWVVSDNVRKGAALNSVQIGELLLKDMVQA